jgi:hypothetical protein
MLRKRFFAFFLCIFLYSSAVQVVISTPEEVWELACPSKLQAS